MIHEDLSKVDGCPKAGVNVTVYGLPGTRRPVRFATSPNCKGSSRLSQSAFSDFMTLSFSDNFGITARPGRSTAQSARHCANRTTSSANEAA